jgi:hypothetical protein
MLPFAPKRGTYDESHRQGDPEIGLEVDLYWKVVQELGKCVV